MKIFSKLFLTSHKQDTSDVDVVITWVDPTDPDWIENRNRYFGEIEGKITGDSSDARYRDWDTVKYLLRSIDKNLPWVRTVHFVTCGHLPCWLNTNAYGLNIVRHEEFIPAIYLPTFSSHTIELNLHRIKGLAEQFINVNDDIIFLQNMEKNNFFQKGLPCDYAILDSLISSRRYSTADIGLTDVEVINDHFRKNEVIRNNLLKWFNLRYGINQLRTILMLPWSLFGDFYGRHYAIPYLRKTFIELWEKEYDLLDSTCRHKFRTGRDVNQWLLRDWQLASGQFIPMSPKGNKYFVIHNNNDEMIRTIKKRRYNMICINDVNLEEKLDIKRIKSEIDTALDSAFPEKSRFEK